MIGGLKWRGTLAAAFKCRLKYSNYGTSAHDPAEVITSQKVGRAEWHFAVGLHTHTHTPNLTLQIGCFTYLKDIFAISI